MNTTPRRSGTIDLAKCIAICAVLLIHCSAGRFSLSSIGSPQWLTALFWNAGCKWAVPLFLMCSGALMNDPQRELPLSKLFSRYVLRLAVALSIWAALYECLRIFMLRGSAPLSSLLWEAAKNWLTGNTYYHLYYFYFAFGLYLALPITRIIARWASEQELRYILAAFLLCGSLLPCLQYFFPFSQEGPSLLRYILPPVFTCIGLGLWGWYLHSKPAKGLLVPILLFLAGFASEFFFTWQRSLSEGALNMIFLDGFSPSTLLMAAGIFLLAHTIASRHTLPRPIAFLSRASFCIYLIHPFFQWLTHQSFFESLPPLWGTPLQAAVLLVLSICCYCVLHRIPIVNRWLI